MSNFLRSQVKHLIAETINQNYNIDEENLGITLVHPEPQFGDFATNAPMKLSGILKKSPLEIANELANKLQSQNIEYIDSITVATPGFINISINPLAIYKEAVEIAQNLNALDLENELSGKTVLIEFGQPNTHKMPHIGHLFSYIFGESLSRILEKNNIEVIRLNYQGDVGMHVAKCLWAYTQKPEPQFTNLDEAVQYLQRCYQEGSKAYEENEQYQEEIKQINTKIYLQDTSIFEIWKSTRQLSLDFYKKFEERLGIKYVKGYLESQVWKTGEEAVKSNLNKVFEESEGAIIFDGEKFGLHKRVFINQKGNTTYEAKDLGLALTKKKDFNFDLSIITTAVEQSEYFKVMIKALEQIDPFFVGKVNHIGFGMINLKEGKMSSRTGKIISAVDLVELGKTKIKEFLEQNRSYSGDVVESISEKLGLASIKYSFLKVQATKNIEFDLEQSINFEGNSAPYIMYAYARAKSIFREGNLNYEDNISSTTEKLTLSSEELTLIKTLYKYPEAVTLSVASFSPHVLCQYIYELAQSFNQFYMNCPILKENDKELQKVRISLAQSSAKILNHGLTLLGIDTLEKL